MTARTYIVLVNWNGHADTIECLESLMRLEDDDFAVVIVDNGSRAGSVAAIRDWADGPPRIFDGPVWQKIPGARRHAPTLRCLGADEAEDARPDDARITLIQAGTNLGFAGANNLGMRFAARDAAAAFFWVLNNDTVAMPDALSALVAHARVHPDEAMIGGVLVYYHTPGVVQGVGGWLNAPRALSGHVASGVAVDRVPADADVAAQLAYVMGASIFLRRSVYDAIGGMSEAYFLYYEELDWARRLPAGATLGFCRDAIVYHKEGGSIGTSSVARPSDTSLYYGYASAMRFYRRHAPRYLPVAAARIVWNLREHVANRDVAAIRVTARVFADALTGRRRRGPYGSDEFRGAAP